MKRERVLLIFLLIILVNISFVSASVVINEVMPQGVEWIEIYNSQNEELNLSEWQIQDNQATDNITCYTITNCSLLTNATSFVIIDRNINISQITNLTINYFYVDDNALGGSGLNNNGENLSFFNLNYSTNFTYSSSASERSWARATDGNSTWTLCSNPTPAATNNCPSPNQPPTANFTFSPANLITNQNITFDASSSSDADGNITAYSWNFGDGSTAAGITVQHAYATAGNYSVNLTVTDSNNASASSAKTIPVSQNQTQQNKTSLLEITSSPAEAYFGSTIDINISVYRNSTNKYAVYLYIESSKGEKVTDKITFHADNKSSNYTFNTSLEIDEMCDIANLSFAIVLEGLDEKINKSITLKENDTLCLPDFEYFITPAETGKINETFQTKVKIINNKDTDTEFDVWSYAYRGSKCYSCIADDREENKQHLAVKAKSSDEVLLSNIVKDAEPGAYSLKIKILKENLKTPKEYTSEIVLEAKAEVKTASSQTQAETNLNAQNIANASQTNKSVTGKAIYKSKIEFNKKRVEIIFASTVLLAALYFLFRQKIIMMRENGV